jgi:hypothetical protein
MYAICLAIIINGQILGWHSCADWAALVEALVAVEPAHRFGTVNQWMRLKPEQARIIRLAFSYVNDNELTKQNSYTVAYRTCAV